MKRDPNDFDPDEENDPYRSTLGREDPEMFGMESHIRIRDGHVETVAVPKPDRFNKWKGLRRIMAIPDDKITILHVAASGKTYYRIDGVTVTWRPSGGKNAFNCLTDRANWCKHTKRIKEYREDNPT